MQALMFQDFESSTNPLLTTINFVGWIAGLGLLLFGITLDKSLLVWLDTHLFIGAASVLKATLAPREHI